MSEPTRFSINTGTYMALVKDSHVYLLQRTNTHYRNGWWCLPAGHIEKDENPEDAAIRECMEEAGVEVEPNHMKMVYSLFRRGFGGNNRTYADYLFVTETWTGEPHNAEPAKASQGQWFPLTDLPANLIEIQRHMLEGYLRGETYSAILENEA